jgi:hypothetical protein
VRVCVGGGVQCRLLEDERDFYDALTSHPHDKESTVVSAVQSIVVRRLVLSYPVCLGYEVARV